MIENKIWEFLTTNTSSRKAARGKQMQQS